MLAWSRGPQQALLWDQEADSPLREAAAPPSLAGPLLPAPAASPAALVPKSLWGSTLAVNFSTAWAGLRRSGVLAAVPEGVRPCLLASARRGDGSEPCPLRHPRRAPRPPVPGHSSG